jgi:hypothetical protein
LRRPVTNLLETDSGDARRKAMKRKHKHYNYQRENPPNWECVECDNLLLIPELLERYLIVKKYRLMKNNEQKHGVIGRELKKFKKGEKHVTINY